MTADETDRDRVAKWREWARRVPDDGAAAAFEMCADDLEETFDDE